MKIETYLIDDDQESFKSNVDTVVVTQFLSNEIEDLNLLIVGFQKLNLNYEIAELPEEHEFNYILNLFSNSFSCN